MKRYQKWTNEAMAYLSDAWGTVTIVQIQGYLKRKYGLVKTRKAIHDRAVNKLKLPHVRACSDYLMFAQIMEILKKDRGTLRYWAKHNGFPATKKMLNPVSEYWCVKHDDLLKWLEENQGKWDSRVVEFYALGIEPDWLKEKRKIDSVGFTRKGTTRKGVIRQLAVDTEKISEMVRRFKAGESVYSIAKKEFLSWVTVSGYLKKEMGKAAYREVIENRVS